MCYIHDLTCDISKTFSSAAPSWIQLLDSSINYNNQIANATDLAITDQTLSPSAFAFRAARRTSTSERKSWAQGGSRGGSHGAAHLGGEGNGSLVVAHRLQHHWPLRAQQLRGKLQGMA